MTATTSWHSLAVHARRCAADDTVDQHEAQAALWQCVNELLGHRLEDPVDDRQRQEEEEEQQRQVLAETAAACAQSVHRLVLASALPIQRDIAYWRGVQPSRAWRAYGVLTDLPYLAVRGVVWLSRWLSRSWPHGAVDPIAAVRTYLAGPDEHLAQLLGAYDQHAIALGRLSQAAVKSADSAPSLLLDIAYAALADIVHDHDGPPPPLQRELPLVITEGSNRALTDAADRLEAVCLQMDRYRLRFDRLMHHHGQPPMWQRFWIPAVTGTWALGVSQSTALQRWDDITLAAVATYDIVIGFLTNYVVKPLAQIYAVVRYNRHELSLVEKMSVRADLESLERMLREFRTDLGIVQPPSPTPPATALNADQPILGLTVEQLKDLDVVMREYEKAVRRPLASTVFGNMSRLLLIQVQKTKVDVELAMTALDKLLKANEINFALITFVPAVIFGAAILSKAWQAWLRRYDLSLNQRIRLVRDLLRNIDITLNRFNVDMNLGKDNNSLGLPLLDQGRLLMNVHVLRQCTDVVELDDRDNFLADLDELESAIFSVHQRIHTLHRIYRSLPRLFM